MSDYICPISFINGETAKSTDLNELFIGGFRDKVCTDYTHSLVVDEIKRGFNFKDLEDNQVAWMDEMARGEYIAFNDAVLSYLICNITDLTINTLILFMQTLKMPNELIDTNVNQIIEQLNVREKVKATILGYFGAFIRDDSLEQTFLTIDTKMNSIYSIFIAEIFDAYVEMFIGSITTNGGLRVLFETLYMLTYQNKDYPEEESYSNMYSFCTSIMREAMDQHTMQFRLALMEISRNAAIMCATNPTYCMNINNPNYVTMDEEYARTGLFGDPLNAIESFGEENDN